jgi:hypothetical protein
MIFCFFFCYISINRLYYISSNADRRDLTRFFVCYISINCLYQWIVPNMYYISSNADWGDSRFSFVIYQSTACISGSYPKCIIYHPTLIDSTCFFFCYISFNCLCSGVECTQILCQKCIKYHPTPIGATLYQWIVPKMYYISSNADRQHRSERLDVLFHLSYINQLPVVEWSVPKMY